MMLKLAFTFFVLIAVSLPSFALESSIDQNVSQEHPDSAPVCLGFIFKICKIGNDTQKLLDEYERIEDKDSTDKFKFIEDYINSKKELKSKITKLNPVTFKKLNKYAILTLKANPSANPRFVVFCGWKDELFLLFDPDANYKQCVRNTEDFLNQYQGTALIIYPSAE